MASRQLIPFTHRFSHRRSTGFAAAWKLGCSRVNPDVLLFTILQLHSRQPQHKSRASSWHFLHAHHPPADILLFFLASNNPDTPIYCSRSSRRLRHPCFTTPLRRIQRKRYSNFQIAECSPQPPQCALASIPSVHADTSTTRLSSACTRPLKALSTFHSRVLIGPTIKSEALSSVPGVSPTLVKPLLFRINKLQAMLTQAFNSKCLLFLLPHLLLTSMLVKHSSFLANKL